VNILQIVSGTGLNGATVYARQLATELARRGHRVTLLCRPGAWIATQFADAPVRIVASGLERWPPRELRRIAAFCRDEAIDVTHSHMSSAHSFGVLLRLIWGVPCVATAHIRKLQLHWMFNDRVIVSCLPVARYQRTVNLVPRRRLRIIPNFIDKKDFDARPGAREAIRASIGIAEGELVILTVGQVIPRKGLLHLVRALPAILAEFPRTRLLVVGGDASAYADRIRTETRRLGLEAKVTNLGQRSDAKALMTAADIFVQPSLEEAQSVALLEAMASGLPAVATRVGGTAECAIDGETALLVPPRRSEALASAVSTLLRDPSLRREMGARARAQVHAHFDLVRQTERIADVLAEAATRRSRR
jgi:L-malate glycosyltransferase